MKLYYECVKNDFMKYYLLEDKYPISFCDLNNVVSTGLKLLNKNKFGLLEKDPYKKPVIQHKPITQNKNP